MSTSRVSMPSLLALLAAPLAVHAPLPVTDAGAFSQRLVQIGQMVLQTAEQVSQTVHMVLEITPVDEVIVAEGIAEDMATLGDIIMQAQGLSYDIQSLNRQITVLFHLPTGRLTRPIVDERVAAIQQGVFECRTSALRAQTLVATLFRTIEHLSKLLNSISSFVGNMQANQRVAELQGEVNKTMAVLTTQPAVWQRSETVEKMGDAAILELLKQVRQQQLEDHPRYERR